MHIKQLRRENTMVGLLAVEFCAVVMSQGVCLWNLVQLMPKQSGSWCSLFGDLSSRGVIVSHTKNCMMFLDVFTVLVQLR